MREGPLLPTPPGVPCAWTLLNEHSWPVFNPLFTSPREKGPDAAGRSQ